jgi:SRSO17 transposase
VCAHSPVFTRKKWQRIKIKNTTRGPAIWEVKAARVHLVNALDVGRPSIPTDRLYWLIVARNPRTNEIKYFVSNAPANMPLKKMMTVGFARWHVEKWFERAKQEAGFGAFEVRTYTSLIRHWLCSRMAMYFLAAQTERLRGEKSKDHPGASRGCSEHARMENMESLATCGDVCGSAMRVLSGA